MKKLLIIIVFCLIIVLSACQTRISNVKNIDKQDIFTLEGTSRYYIFFYRKDCEFCEVTKPTISMYNQYIKKYCPNRRVIYGVVINKKNEIEPDIYRQYTWGGGEGKNGNYYVTGTTKWEELYIATTPALISISTRIIDGVEQRIANYIAQGSGDIISYLENEMRSCA